MRLLGRRRAHTLFISVIIIISLFCVEAGALAWQRALVDAAAEGNIDEVKRLLASGDVGSDELVDALGIAANRGRVEIMKLLLDVGGASEPNRYPI